MINDKNSMKRFLMHHQNELYLTLSEFVLLCGIWSNKMKFSN